MAGIIQPQPVVPGRSTPLGSFLGGHNLFAAKAKPLGSETPQPQRPPTYRLPSGAPTTYAPGTAEYNAAARNDQTVNTPSAGALLTQRGYESGMGPRPKDFEALGHFLSRAGGNLATDAINWPGGMVVAGKAVAHDVGAANPLNPIGHHDFSFKQSRALGSNMAHATLESFLHPNARPGDTLLNLFTLGSLGAGGAARLGAAGQAIKGGEGLAAAATRPGYEGGSLLHAPEPGTQRIFAPGGRPEPVQGPLEQAQQTVSALHNQLAENANRHQAAGLPVLDNVDHLVAQRDAMHEVGQRPPPPELNMAIRLGRERARIQSGIEAAQQQLEQHAAAQAGVNRFDEAQGPRPAISVDRLLPRNALVRPLSRMRNNMIQKALLDETPASARTAVGKAIRSLVMPESTVGREIRAANRVRSSLTQAPVTQLSHATEGIIGHGISRGEHTAIGVAAIEGHHAFGGDSPEHGVETPAQVIERHIATHQGYIDEGKGVEANQQHIADLRMAQQHFENPSAKFMRALEFSRRVSNGTAKQLIDEKMLTPEAEAGRRASIAAMYHGDRFNPSTPAREGVAPAAERAAARTDRLQKAYDALEAKGHRGGYEVSERPKTLDEAHQRFAELDARMEGLRAGMAVKMFGEKGIGDKLTPEEAALQRERNRGAGIADRERLGLTRTGLQAKKVDDQLAAEKSKLEDLQARHAEKPTDALAAGIVKSRTKIADLETRKLSFRGKRLKSVDYKKRGLAPGKAAPTRLVRDDRYRTVEAELDRILEEHKTEPWAQELRKQIDEHDALQGALAPRASFMDEPPLTADQLGTVKDATFKRTSGTMERIGGATSVAKDELEKAEKAAANRVEPTGFASSHPPPEGSFFFPLSRKFTDKTPSLGGSQARTSPGEFGMSPPSDAGVVSKQRFTGKSVEEGRGLGQVARTIAQRATMVHRLVATKKLYDDMWTAASPVRKSEHDVPIRYGKEIQSQLRDFFTQLGDKLHATPDEEMKLNQDELTKLQELLQPMKDHGETAVGATVPGVRWVDQRFLKSTGEVNVRDPLQKLFDTVNNPIRMIQLYGRPAYVLNLVGNLGMQLTTDGLKTGTSMRTAVRQVKEDGADNTALVDAGMGSSRSRSYDVGTGPGHELNRRLAEAWNMLTDLYSRRAAFNTEAARAGFKTPADRARLLHDPKLETKKIEVFRRANKNIVDYDSLTPIEKTYVRRIIYFEPWVTRGTLWALRAVVEHPAKAFTLNELGRIGADKAHLSFGDLPKWAKQLGLIPLGAAKKGLLGTLNPSSINTPATAVQLFEALRHPLDKDVGLQNLVTPATGGATALLTGASAEAPPKGIFKHVPIVGNMIESLPPIQAVRRSGVAPWLAGDVSKTYPDKGANAALAPYAFGGAAQRHVSLPALHAQAEKQKPSDVRAADRVQNEQQTLLEEARRVKLLAPGGQLPPDVVKAYAIQTQRNVAYAKLGATPTQQQRFDADIALGEKLGLVTPAEAAQWAQLAKAKPGEIAKARRWINDHRFGGKLLTQARTAVRHHGGDLHPVQH